MNARMLKFLKCFAYLNHYHRSANESKFIYFTKWMAVGLLILGLSSCMPKNETLDPNLINSIGVGDAGTSDFAGLTSVETLSSSKLKLNWTAAASSDTYAYNIYDVSLIFSPKLIKTVKAPAESVTLTNLDPQSLYVYRVRKVTTDKQEDSNTRDLPGIPYGGVIDNTVISSTSVNLNITDAGNSDSVRIYCKVGIAAVTETMVKEVTNPTSTTVTLTGLVPGETYVCRAVVSVSTYEDNNKMTTTFIPLGQAARLVFSTQPSNSAAGVAFASQPVITIEDANGNVVSAGPDATSTITLTIDQTSPTAGSIRGTAVLNAVKGVATFTGLNIQEAGQKIFLATKNDTSNLTNGSPNLTKLSSTFLISAGPVNATKSSLAITPSVPPSNPLAADGNTSYNVVFSLKDQYSNAVSGVKPQFTSSIAGDTLVQPTTNTDANGQTSGSIATTIADEVAPFRNLSISSPSGLTSVTTLAPFVAGTPAKLYFTTQPVNSPSGVNGLATVQVAVQDVNGNIVRTGAAASSSITLAIASIGNGAVLSGTSSGNAMGGLLSFAGLGIDRTGTGYKLIASSGGLTPAYSNAFNVTSGVPQKIVIAGASSVVSGACSLAITIQLQDNGGNPANAIQSTPVILSGLGSASLFSSSACSGSPQGTTVTFTAGTNTKTFYLKDLASENVPLNARDASSVLTAATRNISVTPSRISISALMPPPASVGTAMKIPSGSCSPAIVISPQGENTNLAPLFTVTTVSVTGVVGSSAVLYTDAGCTTAVADPANVPLPITYGAGSFLVNLYLKDNKAEVLNLNIADNGGLMTTVSSSQPVTIGASKLDFVGPTSVVAGACSTAFTIRMKDTLGNNVTASANKTLNINGLSSSTTGQFYTSNTCSSGGSNSTLIFPSGASSLVVYFSDTTAESLNIKITDSEVIMADSQVIAIGISPAALKISGPVAGNSNTTVCAGPFTVNTLDGATPVPNVTPAIVAITVNLTSPGYSAALTDAPKFFSDNACANKITSLTFNAGDSAKSFYFMSQYPVTTITLTATDASAVVATGTLAWSVKAAKGWLGTLGKFRDTSGSIYWFRNNVKPVSSRMDSPTQVSGLRFDSTKRYLYVIDGNAGRILKYDYQNQKYIGWIGWFYNTGNAMAPISGSSRTDYPNVPSPSSCASTVHDSMPPGWCLSGQSANRSQSTTGAMNSPYRLTEDGTYIYVSNASSHVITRYEADTGVFAGWIGQISGTPTGQGPGGPASCSSTSSGPTPGWCIGGSHAYNASAVTAWGYGNGGGQETRAITNDGTYLYVGNAGAIQRYVLSTGAFAGWIGKAYTTAPTGGASGCTSLSNGSQSPGWCLGGTFRTASGGSEIATGGIYWAKDMFIDGGILYVLMSDYSGYILKFDAGTGAFVGVLPNLAHNWPGSSAFVKDQTSGLFFVADANRVTAVDSTGVVNAWMGKISGNAGMSSGLSNPNSCASLAINSTTPGWCLGGQSRSGFDDTAFFNAGAIEIDGSGNILVGQTTDAVIKKYDPTTGAYMGTLASSSVAPTQWTNDYNTVAENYGFSDNDFWNPMGSYSDGTYLYAVDGANGRIKKIRLSDGQLIGSIGVVTTTPTDGAVASCLTVNPMSFTGAWCLGAKPNPWWGGADLTGNGARIDGALNVPNGITGDGTNLYVVDQAQNRIVKFNASTGAVVGWIGAVNQTPSGGATNCSTASVGSFTPGWCIGGSAASGTGDGMLNSPGAITYVAGTGYLYVVDTNNYRVSAYNASTGAFIGWIGRTNTAPSSGCTPASNGSYTVSATGWCKGGTSQAGSGPGDRGGGFSFWTGNGAVNGIASDGTNLYVVNYNNYRVDKFSLAGVWLGGAYTVWNSYTNVWTNNAATVSSWSTGGCGRWRGLWTDGTNLYAAGETDCNYWWNGGVAVVKMEIATGNVKGWQGGINPNSTSYSPTGGDPGCTGAVGNTPGWCQGGASLQNLKLGHYCDARSVSGDANYIYISDVCTHRITRVPK